MTGSIADAPGRSPTTAAKGFFGWRMVASAFFCSNVTLGFLLGAFGTTMLSAQERLGTGRASVAFGVSLAFLTMSLLSPLVPRMLKMWSLRGTMLGGLVLSCCGYVVLALVPNIVAFLFAYGVLIGTGMAMCGSMTASILASNWFVKKQGTAVGIVNIPLFITIVPLIAIWILNSYGITVLYWCLAAGHIFVLPLALSIVERPEMVGLQAFGAETLERGAELPDTGIISPPLPILRLKSFWLMVIGGGTLNAIGVIAMTHVVALSMERGLKATAASSLVSVIGGCAMLGAFLGGWLCDRLGPARSLALASAGLATAWACIFGSTGLVILFAAAAVHGMFSGGVFPAISVLSRHQFGGDSMARALGLFFPLTLPFTFFSPPLAGWIRDVTGSYQLVLVFMAASCAAVAIMFLTLWLAERRSPRVTRVVVA